MRGSRNLTGRSPLAPLGEPDTHSAGRPGNRHSVPAPQYAVIANRFAFLAWESFPILCHSHASDRCLWRENFPVERYSVSICAQIPTDFRTKHGRKSFRCPIQRGISTALRPLFVTERNRRSRLLARSSVRYSSACASCSPVLCRIFILKFLFGKPVKVPSLTYSREPCILC